MHVTVVLSDSSMPSWFLMRFFCALVQVIHVVFSESSMSRWFLMRGVCMRGF